MEDRLNDTIWDQPDNPVFTWEPVLKIVTDGCGHEAVISGDGGMLMFGPINSESQNEVNQMLSWITDYLRTE